MTSHRLSDKSHHLHSRDLPWRAEEDEAKRVGERKKRKSGDGMKIKENCGGTKASDQKTGEFSETPGCYFSSCGEI